MAEQQESAEATSLLEQAGDVADCVIRCADAAITLGGILFDVLTRRLRALDGVGQRHESRRAEVLREVRKSVGTVLDSLVAGVGQVDDTQHPPVVAVGLGAAGPGGLLGDDVPRVLQRRVSSRHRHRQRQQRRAQRAGQPRTGRRNHCRGGDLGVGMGEGPDMQLRVAQGEPVRVTVDPLAGDGAEQRQDGLERLLHHPALFDGVDAHHVRVRRQRTGTGTEHHPAAGQVVEQHPPVGHHQRMVVGQRHHAGAQPDVLGALGRSRDEHLRAGDQFVATGVVLAEPRLVEAEAVQRHDSFQVVFECHRGRLAGRMERRHEDAEPQWLGHRCPRLFTQAFIAAPIRSGSPVARR